MMTDAIKIIDLFAGPGGLGEGFSQFRDENNTYPFSIVASVEKEASAHRTLTLRAFYRQFRGRETPAEFYEYLENGEKSTAEDFFSKTYPDEWEAAKKETLNGPRALGSEDHDYIFSAISNSIEGHSGLKIVIGGPPCQAYSLVGRSRNKGIEGYSAEQDDRHFLYKEYLKVLDLVQPDIFVMENVKGILSSKVNGESIFRKIRSDLTCPARALKSEKEAVEYELLPFSYPLEACGLDGYHDDRSFIIKSEEFSLPQARHRVILLGVRKKLLPDNLKGELLSKWRAGHQVTVGMVIEDLPRLRSGLTKTKKNDLASWEKNFREGFGKVHEALRFSKKAQSILKDAYLEADFEHGQGGRFVKKDQKLSKKLPCELRNWYEDEKLTGSLNHQARNHMAEDLHRYIFASCYAEVMDGVSPRADEYPEALAPAHKNWRSGKFVDRFKVQARNRIGSTVTSHISKDGHYFIHYDPSQSRSLTVREAARIQTFPDNYFFEGSRTEQYVQVGNAVPPRLAYYIADVCHKIIKSQQNTQC